MTTAVNDIISIELVWNETMICTDENMSLSDRILKNTGVLWDLVQRLRSGTISDHDITVGCLICEYLRMSIYEYEAAGSTELDTDKLFFAKAVRTAWSDLCP